MTRTHDLLITNQLLYRLSYTSVSLSCIVRNSLDIVAYGGRYVKEFPQSNHLKQVEF